MQRIHRLQFFLGQINVVQFLQEPPVNLRLFVDFIHRITFVERFGNGKNTTVGRIDQFFVNLLNGNFFLVAYKTVHSDADHPDSFLNGFFERPANRHDFAYRLHRTSKVFRYSGKFIQIPTRNFADDVVKGGFKGGSGDFGNLVFQLVQSITQAQLGRNESQRITGCFRCQGRRARQPGIYLNHPVIFRIRIERILNITFADNSDVTDDLDGQRT